MQRREHPAYYRRDDNETQRTRGRKAKNGRRDQLHVPAAHHPSRMHHNEHGESGKRDAQRNQRRLKPERQSMHDA